MSIFVEQYDPLDWNDDGLMVDKNRVSITSIILIALTIGIVVGSFIAFPDYLPVLAVLALLFIPGSLASLAVDTKGPHILRPIIKKRQSVSTGHYRYFDPWFSKTKAEAHPIYKEKLMDYLDYLRAGGEPSKTVESHLHEWWTEAENLLEKREQSKDEDIASLFVNTEQLEAYRRAKQDVEKLNR